MAILVTFEDGEYDALMEHLKGTQPRQPRSSEEWERPALQQADLTSAFVKLDRAAQWGRIS